MPWRAIYTQMFLATSSTRILNPRFSSETASDAVASYSCFYQAVDDVGIKDQGVSSWTLQLGSLWGSKWGACCWVLNTRLET